MTIAFPRAWLAIFLWPAFSCTTHHSPNQEMIDLLHTIAISENAPGNAFASEAKYNYYDSLCKAAQTYADTAAARFGMANV